MNKELWLLLEVVGTNKKWKKYFECEYDMDKFIRKLKYSYKVVILDDSRKYYFPDYDK